MHSELLAEALAVFVRNIFDEAVLVSEVEARDTARELAKKEGIFCGISSGGTFAAALKVAQKAEKGSVILAMLPDTGERYLTTFLFELNVVFGAHPPHPFWVNK